MSEPATGASGTWQRYAHPLALARMEVGRCPECDAMPSAHHGGFPGADCSLREDGVLGRIDQYRRDKAARGEYGSP